MNFINVKTTFRNLRKNKLLSFLNIAGLGAGLTVAILIFNYAYREFQADKRHKQLENIYVVQNKNSARVHYEMASLFAEQISGIKYITEVSSNMKDKFILKYNNNTAIKSDLIFTDNNFTKIFSFDLVSGNLKDALASPKSIVLTESEAKLLFNDESPIGKVLSVRGVYEFFGESDVEVKAVIKDLPKNSNLQFKAIVSQSTTKDMMPWIKECIWSCQNVQNYALLEVGQDPKILASHMNRQLRPFIPEKIECDFSLLPYADVYFTNIRDDFKHGNIKLISTLAFLALLILLIAIINNINLSMADRAKRLNEVGVKKIFGVKPAQLIFQFVGESIVISFIAIVFAVFIAQVLTPSINRLSIIQLPYLPLSSIQFWTVIICSSIIIGFLSGFIPALGFSKFKPLSLITGRSKSQIQGFNLKRGLIVFQFTISIILIICTFIVTRQLSLFRNSDMGFETNNIINIQLSPEVKPTIFKELLSQNPGVTDVSFSRWFPGNIQETWGTTLIINGIEREVSFAAENADANYIDLMGLEIVQGRKFSENLQSDVGTAILNEAAVKAFGLNDPFNVVFKKGEANKVIGVVKDFNFQSLHNPIKPLIIFCIDKRFFSVNVKLAAGNFNSVSETLSRIKKNWSEVSPNYPFDYTFIDQEIENLYKSEMVFEKIFSYGSAFAIFISCLGLFGLVLGSTEQRRKEIGIRKVNGAKVSEILTMLNKDFVKWVVIAFVIATPISYYAMNKWLESFAYKTSLSWWIFALSGILALGISLLTVSWQSWRAATRNPVEALRYE